MRMNSEVAEVRRAVQRLARRLRAQRPTDGLTDTELSVLAQVMDAEDATSAGIAAASRTTPQALTRAIASLRDAGLLTKTPSVHDSRKQLLTITARGWDALRRDAAPRDAWLEDAMRAELTAAERGILGVAAELLDRVAAHRPGEGPADRSLR